VGEILEHLVQPVRERRVKIAVDDTEVHRSLLTGRHVRREPMVTNGGPSVRAGLTRYGASVKRVFTTHNDGSDGQGGLPASLATETAAIRFDALPPDVVQVAKHCLLDWLGAAIAGSREPAVELVLAAVQSAGAGAPARGAWLIGRSEKADCLDAALVNGTASHALEIDDSIVRMQAHASVALVPGLLALAEVRDIPPTRVLAALVAGVEYGCRLGDLVNPGHYARGWHASATLGSLAAAAACANLLGLDGRRSADAVGFAAVQSAGLKGAFGSVAKPFQVGRAAAAGVLSALLVDSGGQLPNRVLGGPDGFLDVYAPEAALGFPGHPQPFAIRATLFKKHASCHGTHATLEAISRTRQNTEISPAEIADVVVEVPEQLRGVCGIEEPLDGHSLRFSVRGAASMALLGLDTADPGSFTDAVAADPGRRALEQRIKVRFVTAAPGFGGEARVEIRARDGSVYDARADISSPEPDLLLQRAALRAKFARIVRPVVGAERAADLIEAVQGFEDLPRVGALTGSTCPPASDTRTGPVHRG
jgi:2-methylcitrate dehydratase PrpD